MRLAIALFLLAGPCGAITGYEDPICVNDIEVALLSYSNAQVIYPERYAMIVRAWNPKEYRYTLNPSPVASHTSTATAFCWAPPEVGVHNKWHDINECKSWASIPYDEFELGCRDGNTFWVWNNSGCTPTRLMQVSETRDEYVRARDNFIANMAHAVHTGPALDTWQAVVGVSFDDWFAQMADRGQVVDTPALKATVLDVARLLDEGAISEEDILTYYDTREDPPWSGLVHRKH